MRVIVQNRLLRINKKMPQLAGETYWIQLMLFSLAYVAVFLILRYMLLKLIQKLNNNEKVKLLLEQKAVLNK